MIPFLSLKDVTALHGDEVAQAVMRTVGSGRYIRGCENERFEAAFAQFIGVKHAIGCANGLDALTLVFRAYMEMGVMKPGDEVIVPACTFIATVLAISENGLVPVLVDSDAETLEIDDSKIERAITQRTRAVVIVHLYGRNAYTDRIGAVCSRYSLKLVEDCAQSHGCRTAGGQMTGSVGQAAAFSFYPGKNLGALGDGGAVTTCDSELAATIRAIANYGGQKKYEARFCGRNSRLDEIQAAVLNVKLKYLSQDNAHRQMIAAVYYEGLSGLSSGLTLPARLPDSMNVYHLFPILVANGKRDALHDYLTENGIGTVIHYPIPPHLQACYQGKGILNLPPDGLPVAEMVSGCELSLPIGPTITVEEAQQAASAVRLFFETE